MRTFLFAAGLAALSLSLAGCGGYGDSSPTSPSGLDTPPAGAVIINVVRENGAQSFSPNPATVPAGQLVSWHNVDTTTHHVVLNDGKLDSGNLSPGRYSTAMTLAAPGPYHCTIHPDMVGTIVSGQ
jgi:plastocyanin